jgi:Na+/proline symporter
VGAFVPLLAGLYWSRATTQGAIYSTVLGLLTWLMFLVTPAGEVFPAQLAGLLAAAAGMIIGSLCPQAIANRHDPLVLGEQFGQPAAPLRAH